MCVKGKLVNGELSADTPSGISVQILELKDDNGKKLMKFTVSGASSQCVRVGELELELTLNGTYCRTPANTYSCVKPKKSRKACSYQVLLMPVPYPHAEFEVLRMHAGFLSPEDLTDMVGEELYAAIAKTEPQTVFGTIRRELSCNLPHFVRTGGTRSEPESRS